MSYTPPPSKSGMKAFEINEPDTIASLNLDSLPQSNANIINGILKTYTVVTTGKNIMGTRWVFGAYKNVASTPGQTALLQLVASKSPIALGQAVDYINVIGITDIFNLQLGGAGPGYEQKDQVGGTVLWDWNSNTALAGGSAAALTAGTQLYLAWVIYPTANMTGLWQGTLSDFSLYAIVSV